MCWLSVLWSRYDPSTPFSALLLQPSWATCLLSGIFLGILLISVGINFSVFFPVCPPVVCFWAGACEGHSETEQKRQRVRHRGGESSSPDYYCPVYHSPLHRSAPLAALDRVRTSCLLASEMHNLCFLFVCVVCVFCFCVDIEH